MLNGVSIFYADVGSIAQGNFGWAHRDVPTGATERHRGGREIEQLAVAVIEDLAAGQPGALGFECPLIVPVPEDHSKLGQQRVVDAGHSWSAGAAPAALATGLVQAA